MNVVGKVGGLVNCIKKKWLFHTFMDDGVSEKKMDLIRSRIMGSTRIKVLQNQESDGKII